MKYRDRISEEKYPELVEGHCMNWYVYIAQTKYRHYYVGMTPHVVERILKHNNGKGSRMARQQGPFVLKYISEPFLNKSEARKREIQIKKWTRDKKEKLINREWK